MTSVSTTIEEQPTAEIIPINDPADYSKTWEPYPHSHLIRATRYYKVFIDPDGELDWVTTHEFDEEKEARTVPQRKAANHILGRVAIAQAAPRSALDPHVCLRFDCLLGEALVCSFENDFDTAEKMVDAAIKFHRERKEEVSRSWYLRGAFRITAIGLGLGVLAWLARNTLVLYVGASAVELTMYAAAGTLGALLSVIARSGKLRFDSSSGQSLHDLEAGSRICAGAIAAVLAVLAVKSGMILGPLATSTNSQYTLFFAAVAAGAAERFGSSIISRFESISMGLGKSTKTNTEEEE
jgi:hypothetical protein